METPRRLVERADLAEGPIGGAGAVAGRIGLVEAPTTVGLPDVDLERLASIKVRDRQGRELVTAVELLSPSNKRRGPDRSQYLAKRRQLLAGSAHLVEIDLLRGGEPMPAEGRPDCDYSATVSRAEDRPRAGFWPIQLRDPLPTISAPVRLGEPDARLDLQALLTRTYDGAGYRHYIYESDPDPPLGSTADTWARAILETLD